MPDMTTKHRAQRPWEHDHRFGHNERAAGERRTLLVAAITAIAMVAEITAGLMFGSMALLADGLHMATHTLALGLAVIAYVLTRRYADDPRLSFGTGKINPLAAYTSAILLAVFAGLMALESVERLIMPVTIQFDQAILVAVLGLIVNGLSVVILGGAHAHHHADHEHQGHIHHGHTHQGHTHHGPSHPGHHHHHGPDAGDTEHGEQPARPGPHAKDHNLRAAYLHVLADALTSILAIIALVTGKYLGWVWLDPIMGLVGAALITRWAVGLLRETTGVLVDVQAPDEVTRRARQALEQDRGCRVTDLHVWSIGGGRYAAAISVLSRYGERPDQLKARLPRDLGIVHSTVEVFAVDPRAGADIHRTDDAMT